MPVYAPGWPPNEPHSWPLIVEIAQYYPGPVKMKVSSTKRNGSADWHDYGLAADFYDTYPNDRGSRNMREFARWLWEFRGYYLELIHSTPFSDDNGFYIKNGGQVNAGFFNEPALHLNHVHLAMSNRAATEVLAEIKRRAGGAPPTPQPDAAAARAEKAAAKKAAADAQNRTQAEQRAATKAAAAERKAAKKAADARKAAEKRAADARKAAEKKVADAQRVADREAAAAAKATAKSIETAAKAILPGATAAQKTAARKAATAAKSAATKAAKAADKVTDLKNKGTVAMAQPPAPPRPHTVADGETLLSIAAAYRTTPVAIMLLNPTLTNPEYLEVGRTIMVPA